MCTVSFVKTAEKVIITSNRDESVLRLDAIPPKNYTVNTKNVIYPKDPKAGGTWYVVDEIGTILVLLNGSDEGHEVKSHYRKSRGLIVLDIIGNYSPKDFWEELDLDDIEPFTIVLYQNQELFQLRWNGIHKSKIILNTNKRYIWSSSTLYSKEVREKRTSLFHSFLAKNETINEEELYQFHLSTDSDNHENGLVINRNNVLKTLSITQSVIQHNRVAINYYDLITENDYKTSFIVI